MPEHGPVAQCPGCAAADSGQQLARDQRLDERTFGLYLALASPGLPKIGLTARGGDRLAEQGAWAFTWLTHGPLIRIRAMEQAIARTGVAAERYQRATKITAWATRSDPVTRYSDLHAAYTRITEAIPWPGDLPLEHCQPIDHAELYGLDSLPARLSEVTALRPGAVIVGTTRCLIGRELVLETSAGPMLLDTRLLCGWPLRRPAAPVCTGLTLAPLDLAGSSHDQITLF
ncbi:DUF2797 domain-containing protein [Nocardia terpenica]|uniref:DUF2797 domain-containing protein n=1 Tax=Nocardia terpenica TaxID=455432 RepID=UPI002FE3FC9B